MASFFSRFKNSQDHFIAAAAILVVLMLLVPIPGILLDVLMIANIALSIVVLLVVLYTPRSTDFTSFPRVLLFATLYGLALNVSSTRLIISKAASYNYRDFPASMLKAFSSIVTGDKISHPTTQGLVVGLVIFVILIIIQAIVITKGATRVSEVAARFSLDSMNSKMFAVDSELNSGSITEEQAREKKTSIQRESDFYSQMDGASKFVSGNVKAAIFITIVDLVAGILVGMLIGDGRGRTLNFLDAAGIYSRLTIGDGLLGQLPSLLLSFATGLIVTGNSSDESLGKEIKQQFTTTGYIYVVTGIVLFLMGLIPGFPKVLLFLIGATFLFSGLRLSSIQKQRAEKIRTEEEAKKNQNRTGGKPEEISPFVPPDSISLELGFALIPLVTEEKGADLLDRIKQIRKETAAELGFVMPKIRIVDRMQFDPNEYCVKIRGNEVANYKVKPGCYLCMNVGGVREKIEGEETKDPAFGAKAIWVSEENRARAEKSGYAVFDCSTVIATHLTEIIKNRAADILRRKDVSDIINKVKEINPVVVEEAMTKAGFSYGEIEKVLQGLLREQVSIRDIETILEVMSNYGAISHEIWFLIEKVREALGEQICAQYIDRESGQKKLSVLRLSDASSEFILQRRVIPNDGSQPYAAFSLEEGRKWINTISSAFAAVREKNFLPIILCAAEVRQVVKNSIEREMPGTIVLSINEVMAAGTNISVEILGDINVV